MNIHLFLDISEGDPRDKALSVMYQDYREGKSIEEGEHTSDQREVWARYLQGNR